MQKQTVPAFTPYPFGEAALAASRKVWLASLGATVVTRDWVQHGAGRFFGTLVKQGYRRRVARDPLRRRPRRVVAHAGQRDVEEDAPDRRGDREAGGELGGRLRAAGAAEVAAERSICRRRSLRAKPKSEARAQDGEASAPRVAAKKAKRTPARVMR